MPRLFELGPRLLLCADMVRPGAKLADIGTDHARLPVWLASQKKISRAIAADLRELPLHNAQRNIRRHKAQEVVFARLSDGLSQVFPHEADDIVIAGMGGELIASIVEAAPWLKNPEKHLILQPMTSAPALRQSLASAGFAILREQAVEDEGRVYSVMLAAYAPEQAEAGNIYPYAGSLKGDTPESRTYLKKQADGLQSQADGLRCTGNEIEAAALDAITKELLCMCKANEEEQP